MKISSLVAVTLLSFSTYANHEWNPDAYHQNSESQRAEAYRILDEHTFSPDHHVLDIGCGDGKITAHIAQNKVPNGRVTGLDISPAMIDYAITNFADKVGERLTFTAEDVQNITAENKYDVVTSFYAMQWVPNQQEALSRIHKALRPEGKLIISMPATYPREMAEALSAMMYNDKWNSYFANFNSGLTFHEQTNYVSLLKDAGFENVKVSLLPVYDTFASKETFTNFVRQWLPHLQAIPADKRDAFMTEFIDTYLAKAPTHLDADGKVTFYRETLKANAIKPAVMVAVEQPAEPMAEPVESTDTPHQEL